jgi:hypothetical protein
MGRTAIKARAVASTLAGLSAAGLLGLSLAQAGQLATQGGPVIGAGTSPVSACATSELELSHDVAYSADAKAYVLVGIDVATPPADCVGSTLRVSLADATGARLAELRGALAASGATLTLADGGSISLDDVATTAVVVTG